MDLLQKAISLDFIPINKDYYLWEIQKWLREEHNIDITIRVGNHNNDKMYHYSLPYHDVNMNWHTFKTYEEALEEGLKQALILI